MWTVGTLAGSGSWSTASANGVGTAATFNNPSSLGADFSGGANATVFIHDFVVHSIRPLAWPSANVSFLAGGDVTTGGFADSVAPGAARFNQPRQGAKAPDGALYLADGLNNRIRRVWPNGTTDTFAGNGTAGLLDGPLMAAMFRNPMGFTVSAAGGALVFYVAEAGNHAIRRLAGGAVTTLAGPRNASAGYANGVATAARFNQPYSLAVTADGATLYVADRGNHRIRVVSTATGSVTTLAGNGTAMFGPGAGAAAAFHNPTGVSLHASGALLVAEIGAHRLRLVSTLTGRTALVAGSSAGASGFADSATGDGSRFNTPASALWAPGGTSAIIASDSNNRRVRVAACVACPAGFFCVPSASFLTSVLPCAAGFWGAASALHANSSCAGPCEAPPGSFCPAACASRFGEQCPPGFWCAGGRAQPVACVRGLCLAGSASDEAAPPATAAECPPGYFCPGFPAHASVVPCTCAAACAGGNATEDPAALTYLVSTIAGNGAAGYVDAVGTAASFTNPSGMVAVPSGWAVTEFTRHTVRLVAPDGTVRTLAGANGASGYVDAVGTNARLGPSSRGRFGRGRHHVRCGRGEPAHPDDRPRHRAGGHLCGQRQRLHHQRAAAERQLQRAERAGGGQPGGVLRY